MTQIEMDVARSTIRKNKAVIEHYEEIDWEQRRYEIAKDALCAMISGKSSAPTANAVVSHALAYANTLIEKLKVLNAQE